VHEFFHVFENAHHSKWAATDADLFTYPLDNVGLLARRREEFEALRRALLARNADESRCWAAEAIRVRDLRISALPASALAYERGTELHEGLANYLQVRTAGKSASFHLSKDEFPTDQVRQRNYATGTNLAMLLDRLAPGWHKQIERGGPDSLD